MRDVLIEWQCRRRAETSAEIRVASAASIKMPCSARKGLARSAIAAMFITGLFLVTSCDKQKKSADAARSENAAAVPPSPAASGGTALAAARLITPPEADEKAPDTFRVKLETTKGTVHMRLNRAWAPKGVDRFYTLVNAGFFESVALFRVIPGFVAQFGIHGNPETASLWRNHTISDDPVKHENRRGTVVFATAGPNTRTTQLFINFADNTNLDAMGFAPIGEIEDMQVIDSIYSGYGEGAPTGNGPDQRAMQERGNVYLQSDFPKLDYIVRATVLEK